MLDRPFAERLLGWANRAFFLSLGLLIGGAVIAYGLGANTALLMEVLGHWLIALGALGVKVSYIARLAALDVLKPHPDGWLREARPPADLPRLSLDVVESPDDRTHRKRA